MNQKIPGLVVLMALAALAGAGCKKNDAGQGASDKAYLSDQINPNGSTSPCTGKGAVGAQALLLKGDCANVKVPQCGDHVQDAGEQCDDGNTKDGDGCSAACKLEEKKGDGGGGGSGGKPVCGNGTKEKGEQCDDGNTLGGDGCSSACKTEKPLVITTSTLGEAIVNEAYQFELHATGGSGKYLWSIKDPANVFSISSSSVTGHPKSAGKFSVMVTVTDAQLKDKYVAKAFDIPVKDPAVIEAYHLVATGNELSKGYEWQKLSVKDGVAAGDVVADVGQYNIKLVIVGGKSSSTQWSIEEDGGKPGYLTGVYQLHRDGNDPKVAYLGSGQEIKSGNKVVVAAKGDGGTQTITFERLKFEHSAEYLSCQGTSKITVNSISVKDKVYMAMALAGTNEPHFRIDGKLGDSLTGTLTILGGKAPYKVDQPERDTISGAPEGKPGVTGFKIIPGDYKKYPNSDAVNVTANTFQFSGMLNYANPSEVPVAVNGGTIKTHNVVETFRINIFDTCGHDASAIITVGATEKTGYDQTIGDLKKVFMHFQTEWTDGKSKMQVELKNGSGTILAATGVFGVDGDDPTEFSQYYALEQKGHEDTRVTDIAEVRLNIWDPGGAVDITYEFWNFKIVGDAWYAEYTRNWDGEADGDYAWEHFGFPGDHWTWSDHDGVWLKRSNPGDDTNL